MTQRLRGKTVFLSASVPDPKRSEDFNRVADAPFHVEQGVTSLARAVFSEGGRLVFGGHPSISPLVATIAGEYRAPRLAESGEEHSPPQVVIYQSEAFREVIPRDTDLLIRLGLAEERWIAAAEGEHFVPGEGSAHAQCPASLHNMRLRMIGETRPAAMVCIGGMEGALLEAEISDAEFGIPVYALACTGGAASLLPERAWRTIAIDREIARSLERGEGEGVAHGREDAIAVQPYPLIMQTIVDRIAAADREDPIVRGGG